MTAKNTCQNCQGMVREWNLHCSGCGYTLMMVPDDERKARYLRVPSLGALLFTQGWMFGSRLYLLFALSLVPIVGIAVLILGVIFGRRLSWKYGSWGSWEEFTSRMRLMDGIGIVWVALLMGIYLYARYQ